MRLRATIVIEYDADPASYPSDDPQEMAEIDAEALRNGEQFIDELLDVSDNVTINCEVVDA